MIIVNAVGKAELQGGGLIDTLKMAFGKPVLNAKSRLKSGLLLMDSSGRSMNELYGSSGNAQGRQTLSTVEGIIEDAIEQRASDILINPVDAAVTNIRFRIDGILRAIGELDSELAVAVVNSIKAISSMDIAEKRKAQDGSFMARSPNGNISFRVASAGILHGEKLSIRILNQTMEPLKLSEIGLPQKQKATVTKILHRQSGMILVCGPTGSGKSTSLYSMLRTINFDERNVITIEDPVEYVLPQASQIEINEKAGITFAKTLRSVLRQDPDVISVGEIRDEETAAIALQASQTGHLVFATLHSSSNTSALVRLMDLGVKPLLLASALDLLVSQRLVRRLCQHCKIPARLGESQIKNLCARSIDPNLLKQAQGCKKCGQTGYDGRIGVFDVMLLDDATKSQLLDNKLTAGEFKKHGDEHCRATMQKQGMKLALAGLTDLKEIKRIVSNV